MTDQWEENQRKKEYLNGYLKAKRRESRILEQIQQLRMDKMFPSVQYDDMPHGSGISDLSEFSVRMEELMDKLKQERLEAVKEYTEIDRRIKTLKDELEQEVLTYRYLEGMKWERVCIMIGYSWKGTHKVHSRALDHFEMQGVHGSTHSLYDIV